MKTYIIIILAFFILACSSAEPEVILPPTTAPHKIYIYTDTTHVHPDSSFYYDRVGYVKFDSTDHFELIQYTGRIVDPPARYYVNFYAGDNITLDSQYYFHATSFLTSGVINYNKQELSKHCVTTGRKMNIENDH